MTIIGQQSAALHAAAVSSEATLRVALLLVCISLLKIYYGYPGKCDVRVHDRDIYMKFARAVAMANSKYSSRSPALLVKGFEGLYTAVQSALLHVNTKAWGFTHCCTERCCCCGSLSTADVHATSIAVLLRCRLFEVPIISVFRSCRPVQLYLYSEV